jgi:hypothetical protein
MKKKRKKISISKKGTWHQPKNGGTNQSRDDGGTIKDHARKATIHHYERVGERYKRPRNGKGTNKVAPQSHTNPPNALGANRSGNINGSSQKWH